MRRSNLYVGHPRTLTTTCAGYGGTNIPITITGPNSFTYNAGSGAGSSCGTGDPGGQLIEAVYCNCGFSLFPAAQVSGVLDPTTNSVDGYLALGPNSVPWTMGDTVEEAHWHQPLIDDKYSFESSYQPQMTVGSGRGYSFGATVPATLTGFTITNSALNNIFYGYGGTHTPPDSAYGTVGIWQNAFRLTSAPNSSLFTIGCKLNNGTPGDGTSLNYCGGEPTPDAAYYSIFNLDSVAGGSTDNVGFNTATELWTMYMGGVGTVTGPLVVDVNCGNGQQYPISSEPSLLPYSGMFVLGNQATTTKVRYGPNCLGKVFAYVSSGAVGNNSDLDGYATLATTDSNYSCSDASASPVTCTFTLVGAYNNMPVCDAHYKGDLGAGGREWTIRPTGSGSSWSFTWNAVPTASISTDNPVGYTCHGTD